MHEKDALCTPTHRKHGIFILIFTLTLFELGPFVSIPRATIFTAFLLSMLAGSVWADEVLSPAVVPDASSPKLDQVIYKGVIGNVLDTLPMDPVQRVGLQRTNAVISNTYSGRTLSVLMGLSNPLLIIGGLVWGLWSASNIHPVAVDTQVAADPVNADVRVETEDRSVAFADSVLDGKTPAVDPAARISSVALSSFAGSGMPDDPRPAVIRIWVPQSSSE